MQPAIPHQIASRRPKLIWHGAASSLIGLAVALIVFIQPGRVHALTLAELRADRNLTPERFIKYFADFKFALGRELRKPDTFLSSQCGDCDDFATLAADVLREKGYTTRLVVVYMGQDTHVVCYVAETKSYLDYNCRKMASPLVQCDGSLESIAAHVADSFRAQWRSASEFTMRNGSRYFLNTVFR